MGSRWYPGYTVAGISTVALVLTAPGQTMLVSLLNVPLREAFAIEPLSLNLAYTVATIAASLPLVWMGQLTDRFGPRRVMIGVALAFGLACGFTSLVTHVWMVFLAFFLLRFFGQGSLALVSSHMVAMWFHRRLGTISGMRSVVLFAAWTPLPTVTLALIETYGWRHTWALFGVIVTTTVSLLAWRFAKDRPEDVGLKMDADGAQKAPGETSVGGGTNEETESDPGFTLRESRRTRAYWLLACAAVLPPMIGTAMLFDLQPLLASQGVGASSAALAVSAWSATSALMAIPSGRLVDRARAGRINTAGALAMGTSCLLLMGAQSERGAMMAMAVYAVGQSLVAATTGATTARYFGRRHHGAIRSSLTRMGVIATGVGPLIFGLSHHLTGSYSLALTAFACICPPVALASLWLAPPPRPVS